MVNEQIDLPLPIRQKFHQLRMFLRLLAVFRGMIAFALLLGLLFLADLLGDCFLEFPLFLRGLLLTVSVVWIFYLVGRLLLFPLIMSRTNLQIARLVEQMEPAFGESLITSVELCDRRFLGKDGTLNTLDGLRLPTLNTQSLAMQGVCEEVKQPPLSATVYHHLLRQTVNQAALLLESFNILRLFPWKRLTIHLCLTLLFWGGIVVYCFHTPGTLECWCSRNVRLSSEDWPRLTRMILEGFDEQGIARTVKGEPFSFLIRADLSASRIPSQVHLQFRNHRDQTEHFRTVTLDQFRLETHHGTSYRAFYYTVPELIEPLTLNVFAGDWKREGLVIDVVAPPQILKYDLFCEYPAYQNRAEQSTSAVGRTQIPEGTRLTVVAEMNKPLRSAKVVIDSEPLIEMQRKNGEEERSTKEVWTLGLADLRKSCFLRFELEETNGIRERQPQCLELEMVKDQAPTISAQLQGVGSAITPFAVLPIRGEATDDYGLAEIYFRFRTIRRNNRLPLANQESRLPANSDSNHFKAADSDSNVTRSDSKVIGSDSNVTDSGSNVTAPDSGDKDEQNEQLIARCSANCLQFPLDRFFDVSALPLEPGDWIALSIEANDDYDLEKTEENGDATQGRERERAGQIGKSEIWQLEIISPTRLQGLLQAREITLRERLESLTEEIRRTKRVLEQFQPIQPTDSGFSLESGVFELLVRDQVRLIRDTQKEKYELQDIQEGFQRIREELEINRILTQEERGRLDRDIIIPLKKLVGKDFVELEQLFLGIKEKVDQVQKQSEEKQGEIEQRQIFLEQSLPFVRHHRQQALLLFDVILEQLRFVCDRMLTRETFQDVVEQLREILNKQRAIREETTESKRDQLRRLTE
ncbi:MAG: hypothetical protein ACRC10_13030 [Thermoguttaceae bacterium]